MRCYNFDLSNIWGRMTKKVLKGEKYQTAKQSQPVSETVQMRCCMVPKPRMDET